MYDVIIIGLGPAGVGAGIYAGRNKLKTLIIGKEIGGQSLVSANIENWIGIPSMSGFELAKKLKEHLGIVKENVEVLEGNIIKEIKEIKDGGKVFFRVKTEKEDSFDAKTILISSGSSRRKLNVTGEEEFAGRGVFYCGICDAPLMKGKKVAVVGGGNSGIETVGYLLPHATDVYILEINEKLKADLITQEKILRQEKVKLLLKARILEILGKGFVEGLIYEDLNSKEKKKLNVQGIFVEIGSVPNSDFVKDLVKTNEWNEIIVDPYSGKTSKLGIWAAGDVTNLPYKQNNIAMGDAIRAILNISDYLSGKK